MDWSQEPKRMMRHKRPLCNWCSQNDFSEGCEDCDHPDIIDLHNKCVEFYFSPEPEWPGNLINIQVLVDKYNTENPEDADIAKKESKTGYHMSIDDIAEELGLNEKTIRREIASASGRLMKNMYIFAELKKRMLAGEDLDDIDIEEIGDQFEVDMSAFAETVLYYGEKTNFFNPNQGDTWQNLIPSS